MFYSLKSRQFVTSTEQISLPMSTYIPRERSRSKNLHVNLFGLVFRE